MRYLTITLLLACALFDVPAAAQDAEVIIELNYMKSLTPDYAQIESDIWKPIHQERVRRGDMLDWSLYSLRFGDRSEYDYITVNVYESMDGVEGLGAFDELVSAVHSDESPDELVSRTVNARQLVRSELWRIVDQVGQDDDAGPAPYIQVAYMDVPAGGSADYLSVEQDLWKSMHEATLGTGGKVGWVLYSLVLPAGTDYPYNYGTANFYTSLDTGMSFSEAAEIAHPGTPSALIENATAESRDLVKSELWTLVDATE